MSDASPPETGARTPEQLASEGWAMSSADGFADLVGPIWERREGQATLFGFLVERKHLNRNGVVHGGMLLTFADQSMGISARRANGGRIQATIQLDGQFVAAGREGMFIESRCEVVRTTRHIVFMRATLTAGAAVILTASGVWKIQAP